MPTKSFSLSVKQAFQQFTRISIDASEVFFHYTTHAGLLGIIKDGGLRATSRTKMNDKGEFYYAKNKVYDALNEIKCRSDLPLIGHSIITYVRKNIDLLLKDTPNMSRSYCACLTLSSDHLNQWKSYADNGKGFAIGINLYKVMLNQREAVATGKPFIFCGPVIYCETKQNEHVKHLIETGVDDLLTFYEMCSQRVEDLTTIRNRVTEEIVTYLLTSIDFIKAPAFRSEQEYRLMLDPNNKTLMTSNITYYVRDNEQIPFLFLDLRDPNTHLIPISEIKIGPCASFSKEKIAVESLLADLGYDKEPNNMPRITQSKIDLQNKF